MHKSTLLCGISKTVKKRVYERDKGLCVICGCPGLPEAHVVSRAHLGLGVEENIVTLCRPCHRLYDGTARKEYGERIRNYLKEIYPDWDEQKLIYKKGGHYEQNLSDR